LLDQQIARSTGNKKELMKTRMHAIHLASGDWTHAIADYKEKLQRSEPFPVPEVLAILAELLVRTEEHPESLNYICERAVTIGEQSGARKSLVIALRARGRMYLAQQKWEQAETDLREALRHCEMLDLPLEQGHILYHLGLLYKRRASSPEFDKGHRKSDQGRSQHYLEHALGFYEALGAAPAIDLVQQALMHEISAQT
jgi:tetratricopeptide (TPR) repeat protein